MISQPLIGLANVPTGMSANTRAVNVAGLSVLNTGTGTFLVVFDEPLPENKVCVFATPIVAATMIRVTFGGAINGKIFQCEIDTYEKGGSAVDSGFCLGVAVIPDLD
jgi:hypothetical protein